ncbi:MAG: response regulator [Gammaproteobacteria bacterium]
MTREFCIELRGIELKDRNVLKRILAITEGRTRTYKLLNPAEAETADILIVNADDKSIKEEWAQEFIGTNGICMIPTILASRSKFENSIHNCTSLPFFPTRILKSLDEITVKEYRFTPELRIEEPEKSEATQATRNAQTVECSSLGPRNYTAELSNQELETFIGKPVVGIDQQRKRHALVVDDSLPIRKALDMKLRLMDYDVHHASSGRQALYFIQKTRFDFIFLDVVMPGIDGYEVCKLIKRNKTTKNIPVVMLTSRSSPFDKVKGKLAGCDSYLTKPVEHEKFEKVVASLVA